MFHLSGDHRGRVCVQRGRPDGPLHGPLPGQPRGGRDSHSSVHTGESWPLLNKRNIVDNKNVNFVRHILSMCQFV